MSDESVSRPAKSGRHELVKEAKLVVKTYRNRHDDERVSVLMSRDFANKMAVGSPEFLDAIGQELRRVLDIDPVSEQPLTHRVVNIRSD